MGNPPRGEDWIAVVSDDIDVGDVADWAVLPGCGGLVTFSGTVRDHTADWPDVAFLEYEAYPEYVEPSLQAVAVEARKRWPEIGRIAIIHRVGRLAVGVTSVVVAVSSPHRGEAFDAAEYCIDTVKETAPIWKKEFSPSGERWVECTHHGDEPATTSAATAPSPS